ncbi:MAG: cell division protein FtsW [Lachnospiraceae bacterium]|nr:cell division protein FtsW [Lachnospiraceae bacterium]
MAGRQKKNKPLRYYDYSLLFLIIFLLCFGLVMLYSTSSYYGFTRFDDSAYYVKKQLFATALGVVAMFVVSMIPYQWWMKWASLGYIVAFVLCVAVIFVGREAKGQSRWLQIGPLSFQPSELAKLAIILFLATVIYKAPKGLGDWRNLLKIAGLSVPIIAPILYNNLSTAIIIAGIVVCMLFVASPKSRYFVLLGAVGVVGVALVIMFAMSGGEGGYRLERVQIWLNPEAHEKGYQTLQGLYAIGSGGLFGKGLGESMQKLGFIPEAQNDMIFSVICEELGLFGAVCVIIIFILVIWRLMIIANNAQDLFGSMLVVGVMSHLSIQVVLNIAVVTNSIPNTGISLPFISYGGTSILFLLAEMGLALSVARGIKLES